MLSRAVSTRDTKQDATHATPVHGVADCQAALEAPDVGKRHLLVELDGEQERDVHVDAQGGELLHCRHSLLGPRHLDHHVGPGDPPKEP
jgi:hypothetical protein